MATVNYIANGFCKSPTDGDKRRGMSELRFWNPTPWETTVKMRVYYADRPAVDLPAMTIGPYANPLLVFPQDDTEALAEVGPWGIRVVSDTLLMADHILLAGYAAEGDPMKGADLTTVDLVSGYRGPPERVKFAGGVGDCLMKSRLAKVWYFSDGIIIKTDPQRAAFPFSEFEWYHILNPGPREAVLEMHRYHGGESHDVLNYHVGAERVLLISNYDPSLPTDAYGIRFVSSEPVCIESERFIYGLHGIDEWGAHLHCQRPGLPAPLEWNEEVT